MRIEEHDLIRCIGDSHVSFFSGENAIQPNWPEVSADRIPFFRTYRLDAVLAYNLCQYETRMRGREKLFKIIHDLPYNSRILLCFGEIDCRAHLLMQARKQLRPLEDIVRECAERYVSVVLEILDRGHKPMVWNVIASTSDQTPQNPEYPHVGTMRERNRTAQLFNSMVKGMLEPHCLPFISIFNSLVDENLRTKIEYYMDQIHLSQRAMPLAVAELKRAISFSKLGADV